MAHKGGSESLNDERNDIALHASWEIETLTSVLSHYGREEDSENACIFRLLAKRIGALNSVIMSVLDKDECRTTEEMQRVVNLAGCSPS